MIIFAINKYNTLIDILPLIIRSNIHNNLKINSQNHEICDCLCFHCNYSLKNFCLFDTQFMKRYAIFFHETDINRILYNSIKYNISFIRCIYLYQKIILKLLKLLLLCTLYICIK